MNVAPRPQSSELADLHAQHMAQLFQLGGDGAVGHDEVRLPAVLDAATDDVPGVVFGLDLRVIAESQSEIGITCVSPGDSPVREKFPFYFTGHSDGSICKWTLDVINATLESSIFAKNGVVPVTAIHVFCESQALIAVYVEGIRALYSVRTLRKRLLKASYFEACAACGAKSNPYCCSVCGLWICANCRHKRLTVVCKRCVGADTTPSSAREASGSGSSSGSKAGQEDE